MEEQQQHGAHPTGADVGTAAPCGAQERALEDVEFYKRRAEATQREKEELRGQVETLTEQLAEVTDDYEKLERVHERISEDMEKQLNMVRAGYVRMQGDALSALKEQHDGEMSAVRAEMKHSSEIVKEQRNLLQAQLAEMRKHNGMMERLDAREQASWKRELINSVDRLYKFWEEIGGINGWRKAYPNASDLTKLLEKSRIRNARLTRDPGWDDECITVAEEELAGFVSVVLSRLPQLQGITIDKSAVWPFDMALLKESTNPFPSLGGVSLRECPWTEKQLTELFAMMDANQSKVPGFLRISGGFDVNCVGKAFLEQYRRRLHIY